MDGATTVSDGYSTVSDSKKRKAVSFESGAKQSAEPMSDGALDILSEAAQIKRRALIEEKS